MLRIVSAVDGNRHEKSLDLIATENAGGDKDENAEGEGQPALWTCHARHHTCNRRRYSGQQLRPVCGRLEKPSSHGRDRSRSYFG